MHTRYCKNDKRGEKTMKLRKLNRCEICSRRISDKHTQCYHCRTKEDNDFHYKIKNVEYLEEE